MCLHDAPFLGEAKSIHSHMPHCSVRITRDLCQGDTCEPRQVPGKEQRRQGLPGEQQHDTEQSKSSPCITPEQHGGYTLLYSPQWH